MQYRFVKLGMFITFFLISSCSSNVNQYQPPDTNNSDASTSEQDRSAQKEEGDRGFDPCLINAQLDVCNENENTNSE